MLPQTRAELTNYTETSRHADVMAFIAALPAKNDRRLHVTSIGRSAQGRDLPLLVLSAHAFTTPAESRRAGIPIVLIQSGIHAGEVEGKEGCLMLVRDLLHGPHGDLLAHLTLVVLPLFNPDGNDAIDPGNRKIHLPKLSGQLGPESGVGTRVNAAGINLNRDYLRQDAAEMRLWQANLWQVWEPDLTLDNHATNGSVHRFAMTWDIPHTVESGRAEPIEYMRRQLTPAVAHAVRVGHGYESGWYGNFVEDERCMDANQDVNPASTVAEGWMTYPHHPRFGSNYRGLCGRMDLLLEAYAYLPFVDRVGVAYAWMLESLRYVAAHADEVRSTVAQSRTPPSRVAIRYRLDCLPDPVQILTCSPRVLSGSPTSLALPHLARFVGTHTVDRPRAYAVSSRLAAALRRHGIRVEGSEAVLAVEVPRVRGYGATGGRGILEASTTEDVEVAWEADERSLPAGWGLVLTDQPHGAVAVYLCEPESDDGPIENGLLDAVPAGAELAVWRVP